MKKLLLGLFLSLLLPCAAMAQGGTPNIKESVNYFINYFNESIVQIIEVQQYVKTDNPNREEKLFFMELTNRIDKTLWMALNLRDLYYIYGKTTYCFTKDERKFILDRTDNIATALEKIVEAEFPDDTIGMREKENGKPHEEFARFAERVKKLREFIKSSLAIFQ